MTSTRTTLPGSDQLPLFDLQWPHEDCALPEEARHTVLVTDPGRDRRDVFNGRLLAGLTLVDPYEIPKIDPCTQVPDRLISFSEKNALRKPDPQTWVHFYEDD